jgi:hypothetical protein
LSTEKFALNSSPYSGIREVKTTAPGIARERTDMTSTELQGVLNTATKLFTTAGNASRMGDWARYFRLMDEAENALLYVQLKVADAAVYHAMRSLKRVLEEHRELTIELINGTVPKGEA